MISISEELRAGKAAKAAINVLSPATLSKVRATLTKAKHDAILNISSGGTLNEARANVGVALSNLIHSNQRKRRLIRPSPRSKLGYKNWKRQSHDRSLECLDGGEPCLPVQNTITCLTP